MLAENRFYLSRAKKRAYEHARLQFRNGEFPFAPANLEKERRRYVQHVYRHRASCSCHMCRNPRHSHFHKGKEKLTMQERRALERWKNEEMADHIRSAISC